MGQQMSIGLILITLMIIHLRQLLIFDPISFQCIDDVPVPDPLLVTNEADNCGVPSVSYVGDVSNGLTCPETITRTYSVTGSNCGNSITVTQIITVDDDIVPTINCPGNQVVYTNSGDVYIHANDTWNATATDNCTNPNLTYTLSGATTGSGSTLNGVGFNIGVTYVTWTATDVCGNSVSCQFTVTVHPTLVVNCPNLLIWLALVWKKYNLLIIPG